MKQWKSQSMTRFKLPEQPYKRIVLQLVIDHKSQATFNIHHQAKGFANKSTDYSKLWIFKLIRKEILFLLSNFTAPYLFAAHRDSGISSLPTG